MFSVLIDNRHCYTRRYGHRALVSPSLHFPPFLCCLLSSLFGSANLQAPGSMYLFPVWRGELPDIPWARGYLGRTPNRTWKGALRNRRYVVFAVPIGLETGKQWDERWNWRCGGNFHWIHRLRSTAIPSSNHTRPSAPSTGGVANQHYH